MMHAQGSVVAGVGQEVMVDGLAFEKKEGPDGGMRAFRGAVHDPVGKSKGCSYVAFTPWVVEVLQLVDGGQPPVGVAIQARNSGQNPRSPETR